MAKNKITIDIEVNGKMQKATVEAGKLRKTLDKVDEGQKNVSKSARTADRNLKGAAQASSNSTKNFSKMAQGITGGLVPAYATLAANLFAVSAAFQFLKNASQTERLKQAQMEYAASTGNALGYLSSQLQKASQGMLSFKEASAASAIGAAKGFSSKQMEDLAVSAGRVSKVLGRDFTDAFDRLVRGVSKAEPELLDELGVTLRLEKAKKNYANALGIAVDAMSDFQISQSVLLETQRQINKQFGDIEPDADPFVKLSKTFDDLIQKIASGILPAFQSIATVINNNAELALGAFAGFSMMILKSIIPMDSLKESMDEWGAKTKQNYKEAGAALETYKNKLLRSKMTSAEFKVEGYGVAQGLAQKSPLAGKKGEAKFMKQLRMEADLTKTEMARMSQAVAGALKNIDKQGIVTTGAFKGMTREMVLDMQEANLKIRNQWALTDSKLQAKFKSLAYGSKIAAAAVAVAWQTAAKGVVAAVTLATRGFNIVLKIVTALFSAKFFLELLDDIKILGFNIIKVFSGVIEFVTGWNPFGGWASDKIDQIKADMKFNEELQEMKDNFTSTIDAIIKQIDAATSKGLNFQKMVNTLSQIDILGVKDQMTALEKKINARMENKGFFDKLWETFVPDEQLKDLEKQLGEMEAKLGKLVPKGIGGDKELVSFIESTKEVSAVQQEFKNALTAVSNATSEGNIRNMASAQDKANAVYDKAIVTLTNYYKTLEKGGAEQNILEGVVSNINELNLQKEDIFGGKDLVGIVKEFNKEQERLNNKLAENQVGKNLLKISGLNKLIIEQELEQLAISDHQAKIDQARLDLQEHLEAMAHRSAKDNNAAKKASDDLRKQELQNKVKVLESEQQVLWYKQEINEKTRAYQALLNDMKGQNKVLDVEKQILDLKQKQFDVVKAQMNLESSRAQRQFDKDIRVSRGFFNVTNAEKEAQMKIDLEKKLQGFKINAAEKEFALKQQQIKSEYTLLRLRNKIAMTEAQKTLATPGLSSTEKSQQQALIALYGQAGSELAGAEASALDAQRLRMAATKEEAASIIQALEDQKADLSAWKQIGSTFRSSFTSELSDFFTNWDWGSGSSSFKEAAKAFGRGIAQTVQKKANDIIAEQITEMLFGGMSAASKMASAFEIGGTSAAAKIAGALAGGTAVSVGADGIPQFAPGQQYGTVGGVGVENAAMAGQQGAEQQGFFARLWEGFTTFFTNIFQAISGFISSIFAPSAAAATANATATNLNTSATITEAAAKKTSAVATQLDNTATTTHTGEVIADTIATKTSAATKSASSGGGFFSFLGFKTGGIMSPDGMKIPGYAAGGVARGSAAGHPAILHGNEAVVPLPNGRSIPVDLQQGSTNNQTNNVAVNIAMDGNGSSQEQSKGTGEKLGAVISAAVQRELTNQKRPGGILSPYGAA
jgi:hypothetical protein